jgi:signal transduction histidine kinase
MVFSTALAISSAAAVLAAGIALLTLSRRPESALNRSCAGLFAVLAVSHVGSALGAGSMPYIGPVVWLAGEAWVPALALLFGFHLGRAAHRDDRSFFGWAAVAALAFAVAGTVGASYLPLAGAPGPDGLVPLHPLGKAAVAFALLLHVTALVQLENVFRAAHGEARYRIRYLILGTAALVAIRVYMLSLMVLYGGLDPHVGVQLGLATWVGGALVAYAVVRHRLLDVDVFVSRYVVYNSIALAGTAAYLLIVGLSAYGLTHLGRELPVWLVPSVVFAALTALGVALTSDTVRWRVRHYVDRHFFRNRHDYRVQWQAASRAVAGERTVEGFLGALGRMARRTLGARHVGTLLREAGTGRYVACPEGGDGPATVRETDLEPDPNPAWRPPSGGPGVYRNRASDADILYLPLTFGDERIGLVGLGPRISDAPYHLEDLELVNAMAAQTAVAVRNLQLAQDLARSRETAALHQLSTFFIHDMKNTTNSLGLLARNIRKNRENPAFWDDAEAGIARAVDQMRQVMDRLKGLRESAPSESRDVDLCALLAAWRGEWGRSLAAEVAVSTPGPLPCAAQADLLKTVFTNLVSNAAEAGASRVQVDGEAADGEVRVHVTDNGCGMDPVFMARDLFKPFATTKPQGMGIGLFQSRRIVEQMGGRLAVESKVGRGTRFTVTLPATNGGPPGPGTRPPS